MIEYTLIMIEGQPVTDIYLSEMIKAGYPPKSIVLVKRKSRSRKIRILSKFIGEKNTKILFSLYRSLRRRPKENNFDKISEKIISKKEFNIEELKKVKKQFKKLDGFSVYADNINSKEVVNYLEANIKGAVLTAGGGILRNELLSLPNIRFINIHSGLVPKYKGSDNFFYSLLYGDTPGCSIFYIDNGIDTGKVINKKETSIDIKDKGLEVFDKMDVFNTIKGYIVPYIKIKAFIKYIDSNKTEKNFNMMNLPTEMQESLEGRTFYNMHKEFKLTVIEKII